MCSHGPDTPHAAVWNALEIINNYESRTDNNLCSLNEELLDYLINCLQHCKHEKCTKLQECDIDISNYVNCKMCSDLLNEPVTLLCGHTYCRQCILKREQESFVELCIRCDLNGSKYRKWFFIKRVLSDSIQCNVALVSIIQDCFKEELNAKILRIEGNTLFANGNIDTAEEKYMQAVQQDPASFLSWSNLSHLKYENNHLSEALVCANKVIEISPLWSKGYYRHASALIKLQNRFDATSSLLKYLILEPESVTVKSMLLQVLKELNPADEMDDSTTNEEIKKQLIQLVNIGLEFCLRSGTGNEKQRTPSFIRKIVNKMETELTCALCCRIFFEPTTTPCGHTFCTSCIERSLDYTSQCCICRRSIEQLITVRPKPLNTVIDALIQKYFPKDYAERKKDQASEKEIFLYDENEDITIPIFVCALGLPLLKVPLHIFEPRYKLLVRRCQESRSKMFGIVMYDDTEGYVDCGTMLEINNSKLLSDGRLLLDTTGGRRFQVLERGRRDGYNTAKIRWIRDEPTRDDERGQLKEQCLACFNSCKIWLDSLPRLLNSAVLCHDLAFHRKKVSLIYIDMYRIQTEFGSLPAWKDAEVLQDYGPLWIWWMIRLLSTGNQEDAVKALKSTSIMQRVELINSKLENLKEMFTQG